MKYVLTYHAAEGFAPRARELFPEHQAYFRAFHAGPQSITSPPCARTASMMICFNGNPAWSNPTAIFIARWPEQEEKNVGDEQ